MTKFVSVRHLVMACLVVCIVVAGFGLWRLWAGRNSLENVVVVPALITGSRFEQLVHDAPAGPLLVRPADAERSFTVTSEVLLTRPAVTVQDGVFRGAFSLRQGADDVTVDRSRLLAFDVRDTRGFVIERSVIDGENRINQSWMFGNTDFVIRGNTLRDFSDRAEPDNHSEAIFVGRDNDNGLIEGNTFTENGTTGHLFFSWWDGDEGDYPRNICVRGNRFTHSRNGYYHIQFRPEIPASASIYVEPPPSNTFDNLASPTSGPPPLKTCSAPFGRR